MQPLIRTLDFIVDVVEGANDKVWRRYDVGREGRGSHRPLHVEPCSVGAVVFKLKHYEWRHKHKIA